MKYDTLYQELISKVKEGSKFSVNLTARTIKIDGKAVVENGVLPGKTGLAPLSIENTLRTIEELYQRYKHSIPSERSDSRRRNYFRALPEHELSDSDMLYGEPREYAQAVLEIYVLLSILNGNLAWDEELMGKWFWQSKNDKDLIILKEWVTK